MRKNSVLLVDGSYYVYSIYYALPGLVNSVGEPTWVIYGMVNILRSMLVRYKPEYIIVVFDAFGETFRSSLFKDYKLHRKPMPKDLCVQVSVIYQLIKAMGIPVVIVPGVEADDVIGTLSVRFSEILKRYVYIFSGDKDMIQLITDNVCVVNSRLNIFFTESEVRRRFGICPSLMVDYLSLLGDVSDNVPGVPGIGKVSAKCLVQELGGLDSIYQNLDKVSSLVCLRGAKSISLKLERYRSLAFLSYHLVTIKKDVLLNVVHDDLYIKSIDFEMLVSLFQRYEFSGWLKSLLSGQWYR